MKFLDAVALLNKNRLKHGLFRATEQGKNKLEFSSGNVLCLAINQSLGIQRK